MGGRRVDIALVTKKSCVNPGTRYNARGEGGETEKRKGERERERGVRTLELENGADSIGARGKRGLL